MGSYVIQWFIKSKRLAVNVFYQEIKCLVVIVLIARKQVACSPRVFEPKECIAVRLAL